MTVDIQALVESTPVDPELIPEILPSEARLAIGMLTSDLIALFTRAAAIAQPKELVPGTSMALLEAIPATETSLAYIRVSASDGQQWVSVVSDGQVRIYRTGSVLVPAKKFLDVLKLAPHKATKITVIGTRALIQSGRVRWNIETPVGDRLSVTPQAMEVETFSVPAGPLRRGLRAVHAAIGTSKARGAFMQVHAALGVLTATDGPRLHRQRIEGLDEMIETDIPVFAVNQVLALLDIVGEEDRVEFGGNDRRILFRVGTNTLVVQRLYERFPDTEALILAPTFANDRALTIDRVEILNAIKRVRINADPSHAGITLGVSARPDGHGWALSLSARDRIGNAAQESIACQWNGDTAHEITLNHVFLTDMLNVLSDDTVIVRVGPDTKTNRTPVYIENGGFIGVLSQLRTEWVS